MYQEQKQPSRICARTVTLSQQISSPEKLTQTKRLLWPDSHFAILMNVTSSSTYRLEYAVCCKLEAQQTLLSFQPVHIELF